MKLSVETILERIEQNPNYFTKVRAELRNDPNFVKLAVFKNPRVYFNLTDEEKNDKEIVQIVLDNARYDIPLASLKPQDEKQQEQIVALCRKRGYMRLYKDLFISKEDNKKIKKTRIDVVNEDLINGMNTLFDGLNEVETDIIKERYELDGHFNTRRFNRELGYEIKGKYCVEVITPRKIATRALVKMKKNYNENKESMVLKLQ